MTSCCMRTVHGWGPCARTRVVRKGAGNNRDVKRLGGDFWKATALVESPGRGVGPPPRRSGALKNVSPRGKRIVKP